RLLHAFADPADPLAQQGDELDRNGRLAFEEAEEIIAPDDEQLGLLLGGRVGGARLAVKRRDFAGQVAGAAEVEGHLPPAPSCPPPEVPVSMRIWPLRMP